MKEYRVKPRDLAQEYILSYIREENLQPHDRLPSERELSELWNMNRGTLRSAIGRMEKDGLLYSKHGAGTFLAMPKLRRNLHDLHSFSESVKAQERMLKNRLLSMKLVESDKHLSEQFHTVLGTLLYEIVRLRIVDEIPLLIETAYVPKDCCPGLENYNLEEESLFQILEEFYGVVLKQGEEKISITYTTEEESSILELPAETPVFWLVSRSYDEQMNLTEYCRTVARPNELQLTTVLEWREGGNHG